ncbi:hypothetical protein [Agromyces laixinhei]|uniref:hypothetical protein n=1 Tax=Agromyces laixinhei TaxID=2585717 RepID=UPI0011165F21|nr:hypothetical protein [Agromyces laixinhei]
MRTEPPTGVDLARLLASMKEHVLEETAPDRPARAREARIRNRIIGVVASVALLLGAGAGAAFALGLWQDDPGTTSSAPGSTSTPRPSPTPTGAPFVTQPPAVIATPEPTGNADRIPHDCEEIYTRDLTPDFHGLTLNPEWTNDPASWGGTYFDDEIQHTATSQSAITCKWASNGPSDRGLFTDIAYISPLQMNELPARLQQLGQTCYTELHGTRCVYETTRTADGNAGESHFFRDGIWIATHWVNAGPDGYTHDIVAALFG